MVAGANIAAVTRDGLSPLHCAARSGHSAVVSRLLQHGAPITSKTKVWVAALYRPHNELQIDPVRYDG